MLDVFLIVWTRDCAHAHTFLIFVVLTVWFNELFTSTTLSHGICESVVRATTQVNGKRKFDPLPRRNYLTGHHQKLHTWLCPGYLATCKIYSRTLKGILFHVCVKLHIKNVYLATFFFCSSNSPQPMPPKSIFTHSMSNDVVPHNDVPFPGYKTKI